MTKNSALLVAGIVFLMVALGHLLRITLGIGITVSGQVLPMWPSYVGLAIALILSIGMFVAYKKP